MLEVQEPPSARQVVDNAHTTGEMQLQEQQSEGRGQEAAGACDTPCGAFWRFQNSMRVISIENNRRIFRKNVLGKGSIRWALEGSPVCISSSGKTSTGHSLSGPWLQGDPAAPTSWVLPVTSRFITPNLFLPPPTPCLCPAGGREALVLKCSRKTQLGA